jgi:heme/copper-type cytochrome/quinol oxidase subunit 3
MGAVIDAPPRPPVARRTNGRVPPPPPPTGGGDGPERDQPPRRPALDNLRLAMMFFIAAEIMFFMGLISAFLILRMTAPVWPPPLQPRLPLLVTSLNTLVLLASSVAMIAAGRALARHDARALSHRLGVAAALGAAFLIVQGYEWVRLVHFGLTVSSGTYGATFYTLIGAHAAHVLAALVWLVVARWLAARGRFGDGRTAPVKACAMYWHFVVALWPVLYVLVYLV